MQEIKNLNIASDIGNGFSKVAINGKRMILQPSLVAHINQPLNVVKKDKKEIFNTLENSLDITVQSSTTMNGRFLIGQAAKNNHFGQLSFNINSTADKAHSDLTILMNLGMITLNVLSEYKNKELPSDIQVTVSNFVTALPIIEAADDTHINYLKNQYLNHSHIVIVNNFNKPITLNIKFKNVEVTSEGVIGNLGLIFDPKTYKYRNNTFFKKTSLPNLTGNKILQMENVIGVDIGDGTIDISAVGKDLTPLPGENQYIDNGIGNVVDNAIQQLRQKKGIAISSRQVFLEQSQRDDAKGRFLKELLQEQLPVINNLIIEKIKTVYTNLNSDVALIYFHGAGANTIKKSMSKLLKKTLEEIDSFNQTKVLWLKKEDNQWLNLDGLMVQLNQMK